MVLIYMGYYLAFIITNKHRTKLCHLQRQDEPRDCHSEWSSSQRKNIYTYMWNVEKWYWQSYLWSRNGDIDVENKSMLPRGDREVALIGNLWWTYSYFYIFSINFEMCPRSWSFFSPLFIIQDNILV